MEEDDRRRGWKAGLEIEGAHAVDVDDVATRRARIARRRREQVVELEGERDVAAHVEPPHEERLDAGEGSIEHTDERLRVARDRHVRSRRRALRRETRTAAEDVDRPSARRPRVEDDSGATLLGARGEARDAALEGRFERARIVVRGRALS